jgi:hypothetical protein
VLVAVSLVAALVFGGRSVLWCPWMQQVMKTECCHAKQKPQSEGPAFERSGCCETRVLPGVPSAKDARDSAMPTLAFAALVVRPEPLWERTAEALRSPFVSAEERGARAGPSVPIYVHNCAFLL